MTILEKNDRELESWCQMPLLVPWSLLYTSRTCNSSKAAHFIQCGWPEGWVGSLGEANNLGAQAEAHTCALWFIHKSSFMCFYMADTKLKFGEGTNVKHARTHSRIPLETGHRKDKHIHHWNQSCDWALYEKKTNLVLKDFQRRTHQILVLKETPQ